MDSRTGLPHDSFAHQDLRLAFSAMPVAVSWSRLTDQTILYRNPAFCQLFGYEPDRFDTVAEWIKFAYPFAEDRAHAWDRWGTFFASPPKIQTAIDPFEVRILCQNGVVKTILQSVVLLPEIDRLMATFLHVQGESSMSAQPSGERRAQETEAVYRMLASEASGDTAISLSPWEALIGDRHRQREALRLSEELLDRTGRLAGVGGWDVDLLTGVVSWTAETRRLHAVPPDYQPTVETGVDFYTPESRVVIRSVLEHAISTGRGWDVEASLVRADGQQIWVRVLGSVEFADGNPVRLIGAFQDITARINERNALKLANERLILATDSGDIGIWDRDITHDTMIWDDRMYRLYGLEPGSLEPSYAMWMRFVHPGDREDIDRLVRKALESTGKYESEFRIVWPDGSIRNIRASGQVTRDGQDRPTRIVGANWDVTARVNESNALDVANERLVLATASGHIATWDWDIANQAVFWDDPMYRLYGLDPALKNGGYDLWAIHIHPEDLQHAANAVAVAVETAAPYDDEFRVLWDDGTIHHVRAMGQATHDAHGRPLRFVGVNWDVTDQRRLARERAEQAELFRVTLESIGDGVITTDAHARVRWMNSIAERLTGWTTAQAVDLPLATVFNLIHEETRQPVDSPLADCLLQQAPVALAPNTLLIARDGTEIGIDDSAAPIRDERGEVLGVVIVFHDVTEQRRLALEAARVLKLDLQMKDDFLSHVSHELRSPLASIYSFAGILADGIAGDLNPSQHEYLDIILRNSRQLRSMIDDLLQVTRSETGKLSITLQDTSVHEAIQESLNTLTGAAEAKSITLTARYPNDLPPALADPTRLRQILIIILDNAVKFTPPGGSITLDADVSIFEPEILQIRIADTGPGIDQAAAERIFEHLYQVDEPGREGRNGLGLGLYIARDLVNRQGGKIWADSGLGEGSEFSFTLPVFTELPAPKWTGPERRKTEVPGPLPNALQKASI